MKMSEGAYITQAEQFSPATVPEPSDKGGYDIKTLQRVALFDREESDVVKLTIANTRGERGHVYVKPERLVSAVERLLGPETGVLSVAIER